MGNTVSENECKERIDLMASIMSKEFPALDIGNKNGMTGYLDFFRLNEMTASVMKGYDASHRPFFTVRAKVIKSDGSEVQVFETFFQRYSNNDILWHGCGHGGTNFMSTDGGMSLNQMKFLYQLVTDSKVELTTETMNELRIGHYFKEYDDQHNEIVEPHCVSIELM